jgi:hypothetical protein
MNSSQFLDGSAETGMRMIGLMDFTVIELLLISIA